MVNSSIVKFRLAPLLFVLALAPSLGRAAQPRPVPEVEPTIQGSPLRAVAQSRIETPAETHWVGELFPLTLRVSVARRAYSSVATDFEWAPDDLIFEEWSPPEQRSVGGTEEVLRATRAYLKTAGTLRLPDTKHVVTLVTGYAGDRSPLTDRFIINTVGPVVRLRDLPTPAPGAFNGAVGDFTLESRLSRSDVNVGDSVTWTVQLRGTGNWPEITRPPARVIPKDCQGMAPILKREFKEGAVFEGALTEDVLIVPNRAGLFELGPVRFVFFDPKEGKYQLYTTETFTLNVVERAGSAKNDQPATTKDGRTIVPAAPPLLPLDPLPESDWGWSPFSPAVLDSSLLLALGGVVAAWLTFAHQRSQLTDPLYPRRRARGEIVAILRTLEKSGHAPAELRRLMFLWQRNVAELAGITAAMPSAAKIARALEGANFRPHGSSWVALWQDANRTLYGPVAALPLDWVMRASAALSDIRIAPVPFGAVFLRRNLIPLAATLAFAGAVLPSGLPASPLDDYRKGDFAAAEKAWRQAAATAPLDAHTRYNLSLAAAQQNHWSESLAHSLAAFCLAPRQPAVRWQLALSLERSGIENPAFSGFAGGSWPYRIARTFSPGEWSLVGSIAAFAAAVSLGAVLFGCYRRRRAYLWTSGAAAVVTVGLLLSALLSLRCWAPLAEDSTVVVSRNILLCSVPTEIDTSQKTVPLPAGSLARVDRSFLGWSRLVFPNQQTGWARTDALVRLYR